MKDLARLIRAIGDYVYAPSRYWRYRAADNYLALMWELGRRNLNEHPLLAIPLGLVLAAIVYIVARFYLQTAGAGTASDAASRAASDEN